MPLGGLSEKWSIAGGSDRLIHHQKGYRAANLDTFLTKIPHLHIQLLSLLPDDREFVLTYLARLFFGKDTLSLPLLSTLPNKL